MLVDFAKSTWEPLTVTYTLSTSVPYLSSEGTRLECSQCPPVLDLWPLHFEDGYFLMYCVPWLPTGRPISWWFLFFWPVPYVILVEEKWWGVRMFQHFFSHHPSLCWHSGARYNQCHHLGSDHWAVEDSVSLCKKVATRSCSDMMTRQHFRALFWNGWSIRKRKRMFIESWTDQSGPHRNQVEPILSVNGRADWTTTVLCDL